MLLKVPAHYFLVLSCMLAACATRPTNHNSASCLQDLEAIPPFLLENDTGAKDHLAQKGQFAMDAALTTARQEAGNAQTQESCNSILNTYLKAWRHGHLAVVGSDPETQRSLIVPEGKEDALRPRFKALSRRTALLTLPSFDGRYKESLKDVLQKHRKALQSRTFWIVDVRRNGGGSDYTYRALLPWLISDEMVNVGAEWLVTPHNITAQETVCAGDAKCEVFIKPVVDAMRRAPAGSYAGAYESGGVHYGKMDRPEPRRPIRVAVLMDGGCGSSCEQFLLTVKQSFSVKLVGRRSYGTLDYSNLRPFDLPSGKRQLWYATSRSQRLPHLPVDLAGVPPDVFLPAPSDEAGQAEEILRVQRWLEGGSLAPVTPRSTP